MPLSSVEGKRAYNATERDAYHTWVELHGPVKGGQKGFRRILKERGMKVPHHYGIRPKSPEMAEAERKFVEEGLGRQGRYHSPLYPQAPDFDEGGDAL